MPKKNIYIVAIIFILLPVVIYVVKFNVNFWWGTIFCKTQDFGSFENYISIGIGLITIFLLYITYKEQHQANRISQFEQRFYIQCKNIKEHIDLHKIDIVQTYNRLTRHLTESPSKNIENSDIILAFSYYYEDLIKSNSDNEKKCNLDFICDYFLCLIKTIDRQDVLSKEIKKNYIYEISRLLTLEFSTILIFYICHTESVENWRLIRTYDIYLKHSTDCRFLDIIIKKLIDSSTIKASAINQQEKIEFESFENEQIELTIKRLKAVE